MSSTFYCGNSTSKGVVLYKPYEGTSNGDMFSGFIKAHFQGTFSRCRISKGKRFLQHGCPVQNRKKARQALDTVAAIRFNIPPCLPVLNPIENVFNVVKSEIGTEAFEKINYDTFEQFSARVNHTLESTSTKYVDKTIELM